MIILGWGHRKGKCIGPVDKRICPRCRNEDWIELHQVKESVSLFFIPLIPYRTEYLLVCPICQEAQEVPPEQVAALRRRAEANLGQVRGERA